MSENYLFYGDNLDILHRHVADESVDLVYLDPPFNSNASYNILFASQDGTRAAAQIRAFEDTWRWDQAASYSYQRVVERGGAVSRAMQAFRTFLGENDVLAYLAMMAPRLVELRRVMKPTASIYLHCDPTASHYLKMLMDAVFGPEQYRNEIIWKRTPFSGSSKARARQYPRSHDVILFYSKTDEWKWQGPTLPYTEDYLKRFKWVDERGNYRKTLLKTYSQATLERLRAEDRLIEPERPGAHYSYKQYLHESSGVRQIDDVWLDINMINPVAKERLSYPTQKPEALLERIIEASSEDGDVILDPFCGCGTAISVAQKLNRRWIGIDITHLAVALMKHRLANAFGDSVKYKVIGEPTTTEDAEQLAQQDPYQFQWWALGLVEARPMEGKKGADRGIDGRLYFHEGVAGDTKQVILSVKAGKNIGVSMVRDLGHVVQRENAQIGVLITMKEPTQAMRKEAAGAGFYHSSYYNRDYPRLQIRTVAELLDGRGIEYPAITGGNVTFKRAERVKRPVGKQLTLGE